MRACVCAHTHVAEDVSCKGALYRPYVAFAYVIFLGAAGYYAREALSGLSTEVRKDFHLSDSEYGVVSTVVAVPIVFLTFAFGSLLDAFGVRRCTVAYTCILATGGLVVALSTLWTSVAMLNLGRVAIGMGVYAILTSQKLYTKAIFPSTQAFATAMSIVSSGLHCGSFLALLLGVQIEHWLGTYRAGLWAAALFTLAGMGVNVLLLRIEKDLEYDAVQRRQREREGAEAHTHARAAPRSLATQAARLWAGIRRVAGNIRAFPPSFWLVVAVATAFYGGFLVFVAFAREVFQDKTIYGADADYSSLLSSSFVFITIPLNPLICVVANKTPTTATAWLIGGMAMFSGGLLWFNLVSSTPWMGVILVGLSGAVVSSVLWGLVPVVVPDHSTLGVAFATVVGVENAVIFGMGIVVGHLKDVSGNFHASLWCLTALALSGVAASSWLLLLMPRVMRANAHLAGVLPAAAVIASEGDMEVELRLVERELGQPKEAQSSPLLPSHTPAQGGAKATPQARRLRRDGSDEGNTSASAGRPLLQVEEEIPATL